MSADGSDVDVRYARGEIAREEWDRLRLENGSLSSGGTNRTPARSPNGRGRKPVPLALIAVGGLVLALVLVLWAVAGGFVGSSINPSYGGVSRLSLSELGALNATATAGLAYSSNDTLWFPSGPIHMVIYASPADHDLTFVVQGLVNPTIHATSGSRITVSVVNMDPDMYHNWALSRNGPTYGSMPMMASGMMMSMAMLDPMSGSGYWSQTASFTTGPGSYWYLCDYLGHASSGMYGAFIVS